MKGLKVIITVTILFFYYCSNGQSKSTFFKIEGGYLTGIGNINYDNGVTFVNQSDAYRLRVSYGFYFNDKTSVGLGVGLDGYHNPELNTLPFIFELRRFFKTDSNSPFVFLNLGSALELSEEFEKGLHFSSGIGYFVAGRRINLIPSIGINIQNIANGKAIIFDSSTGQIETIISKITLNSISLNLGVQF